MSKLFIEETTLTSIGDAIRTKTGKSDLIAPGDMAAEIEAIQSGGGEMEPIVLTGDQTYGCAGNLAGSCIDQFGNSISTLDITNAISMFRNCTAKKIPFKLNFKQNLSANNNVSATNLFTEMRQLIELPELSSIKIGSFNNLFDGCFRLREIPYDYFDVFDMSYNSGYAYANAGASMFNNCYSLRKHPDIRFLGKDTVQKGNTYLYLNGLFSNCYTLDEAENLPIPFSTITSNIFGSAFTLCQRLKRITFETNEDGSPKTANWKTQTIDLTKIGYASIVANIIKHNSGITEDKEVKDDATYQALKDDPDWFTLNIAYSRFNKASAIEMFNSLPDTSAYLAANGGTNTIKLKNGCGSATDGGAIRDLTAEEIAVAAAKGWTVSLSN